MNLQRARLIISATALHTFWSAPLLLPARGLWYRTISKKLPTTSFLNKIKTVDFPLCRLYKTDTDTLHHFLFYCPIKQDIWWAVLPTYFPDIIFNPGEILDSIMNLTTPKVISRSQTVRLFTVISITHWTIWIHYWQHIIHY